MNFLKLFLFVALVLPWHSLSAQSAGSGKSNLKLIVYYFHPTDRCPIDQSIEETIRKMMVSDFAGETKQGSVILKVLNTDDKANAGIVAKFEINAQALYLVYYDKGKEIKKDLTEFAFSICQSNPGKFKAGLREEMREALK